MPTPRSGRHLPQLTQTYMEASPMQHSHDTPPQLGYFNNGNRLDGSMPLQKLTKGGRPSKGDRHTFNVKPDIHRAEKLRAILDALGTNAVDYLTPIVAEHIDRVDLTELQIQEALPIAKAG
jgi:hypothetical protein